MRQSPEIAEEQSPENTTLKNSVPDQVQVEELEDLQTEKEVAQQEQKKQKEELEKALVQQDETAQAIEQDQEVVIEKEQEINKKQSWWSRIKNFFSLKWSWWTKKEATNTDNDHQWTLETIQMSGDFNLCETLYRIKQRNGEVQRAADLLAVMKVVAQTEEQKTRHGEYLAGNIPGKRLIEP